MKRTQLRVGAVIVFMILLSLGISMGVTVSRLHEEVTTQTKELANLHKSLDETSKKLQNTEEQLDDVRNDNFTLRHNLERTNAELQSAKEENSELGKKLKQREQSIRSLEKQVNKQTINTSAKTSKAQPKQLVSGGKSVTKTITMSSTAYTASCKGCSGVTRWKEIDLRANPGLKVIAVDPNVIPLGSKVHVEGYGDAIAADTGGAIHGNKIDIFIPNHSDAVAWGRKQVSVKVYN